jgi:FKBP-type peptidyl-prolyl cis-trans isomerase
VYVATVSKCYYGWMKSQIAYFSFAILFLLVAGGGLYFFVFREDVATTSTSTLPLDGSTETISTQPSVEEPQKSLLGTQEAKPNQQPSLPSPSEFSVYEEYATAESSLYIDTKPGIGLEVVPGDTVAVVYSGYLSTGELFDQSRPNENNEIQPIEFTIGSGQVIPGWEQTILGMKTGGTRRLIIPSAFGYGPAGQGPIPPNAMLIFDVELVGIKGQ